jgi:hypothetical protein
MQLRRQQLSLHPNSDSMFNTCIQNTSHWHATLRPWSHSKASLLMIASSITPTSEVEKHARDVNCGTRQVPRNQLPSICKIEIKSATACLLQRA